MTDPKKDNLDDLPPVQAFSEGFAEGLRHATKLVAAYCKAHAPTLHDEARHMDVMTGVKAVPIEKVIDFLFGEANILYFKAQFFDTKEVQTARALLDGDEKYRSITENSPEPWFPSDAVILERDPNSSRNDCSKVLVSDDEARQQ